MSFDFPSSLQSLLDTLHRGEEAFAVIFNDIGTVVNRLQITDAYFEIFPHYLRKQWIRLVVSDGLSKIQLPRYYRNDLFSLLFRFICLFLKGGLLRLCFPRRLCPGCLSRELKPEDIHGNSSTYGGN